MANIAEVLVETLVAAGVKRVYGLAGDSLNGMTESIRKHRSIEWLHVRHEEVAAFAAGADAHLPKELARCAGRCGPGELPPTSRIFFWPRHPASPVRYPPKFRAENTSAGTFP